MNRALSVDNTQGEILQVLMAQWPGRISLTRTETARAWDSKHPITMDRLRQRRLLNVDRGTRRAHLSVQEIAGSLAETSEGA